MSTHPTKKRCTGDPTQPKSILKRSKKPDPPSSDEETESDATPPRGGSPAPSNSDYDSPSEAGDDSDDSLDDLLSAQSALRATKKRKRNDPSVFATSMSKILGSHLPVKTRSDPVLVRSGAGKAVRTGVEEGRLEAKAKRVLAGERKREMEKGRVRRVVLGTSGGTRGSLGGGNGERGEQEEKGEWITGAVMREKALRKVAQRGVVRLFNAVRAAQVKAEVAGREAREGNVIGRENREEKGTWDRFPGVRRVWLLICGVVTEMSKQGFLDLITSSSTKV